MSHQDAASQIKRPHRTHLVARLWRKVRQNQPFTTTGRVLAFACGFCFLAIVDESLAALLSYLLWLLIFAFGCGLYYRPRLRVTVDPISIVHSGEQFWMNVELENVGSRTAYDLECTLMGSVRALQYGDETHALASVRPGERITVRYSIRARQRGVFALPAIQIDSLFPFAVFRFMGRYQFREQVTVAPALVPGDVTIGALDLGETDTLVRLSATRQTSVNEYVRSLEYRPGMAVRRWDFASWARLGHPTVRQFSDGNDASVVVVVDAHRQQTATPDPALEEVLSRTAGIVSQLLAQETLTSLFIIEDGVEVQHSGHFDPNVEFMSRLAEVVGTTRQTDWVATWRKIADSVFAESNVILVSHHNRDEAQRAFSALGHELELDVQVVTVMAKEAVYA